MVFENKYTQVLIKKIPGFKDSQALKYGAAWMCSDDELLSICGVFSLLVDYIINEIIPNNSSITKEEIDIYKALEELRLKFCGYSDETPEGEFDTALCTCFLESFINCAGDKRYIFDRFIPYLGEKSKEYCKAWDQFTGVRSPGLWDDLEWHRAPKGPKSMMEENNKLDK